MKKIYIYPAPDKEVRDPRSKELLPETGAWVPYDGYWLRRLRDGDVVYQKPEKKPLTLEETLRSMKVAELKEYAQKQGLKARWMLKQG